MGKPRERKPSLVAVEWVSESWGGKEWLAGFWRASVEVPIPNTCRTKLVEFGAETEVEVRAIVEDHYPNFEDLAE